MKKIALITGGSSGLGFAFAELLGKENYKILILARNPEKIGNSVQKLIDQNMEVEGFACDVSNPTQLQQVSDTIKSKYNTIDFLILNAGVVTPKLLSEYTDIQDIKNDIDIDLMGHIYSTYYFTPLLVSGSKILMISSGFGLVGSAGYSIYCAAKAGVVNFAESIRRELLCKNIQVYVACPGDMDTPQFEYEISHQAEWMKQSSPRKVMPVKKAAAKILNQCKGKYKFLILIGSEIKLLNAVNKMLPRKMREWLVDTMLPRPK